MIFLIGLVSLLIFIYSLYLLGKDDYVLIRKNLSLEQLYDFVFLGLVVGLAFARILSVLFHPVRDKSFISQLFSFDGELSLTAVVYGSMLAFYFVGRYRKLPIGRICDFLSLALLSSLPAAYLLGIFLAKESEWIYYLAGGIFYLLALIVFWKILLPRVNNNRLREGSLSALFLLIFSLTTLVISSAHEYSRHSLMKFTTEDFVLLGVFLLSSVFLLRRGLKRALRRKI